MLVEFLLLVKYILRMKIQNAVMCGVSVHKTDLRIGV